MRGGIPAYTLNRNKFNTARNLIVDSTLGVIAFYLLVEGKLPSMNVQLACLANPRNYLKKNQKICEGHNYLPEHLVNCTNKTCVINYSLLLTASQFPQLCILEKCILTTN